MIVDLFAGPGGWSEGLRQLGLRDVGLEWDASACATRAAAGHLTVRTDVALYPVEPFVGKVRGLIASPPCQAWSMAGERQGQREVDRVHAAVELCREGWTDAALRGPWLDERTPLILQPLRWAWALRDSLAWVACEQVPPAFGVWRHVADVLRGWGFAAEARELDVADFGVPQNRNRAYLLAHRDGLRWPEPTHAENPEPSLFGGARRPWLTMAAALGWGFKSDPANTVRSMGRGQTGPDPLNGGQWSREKYRRAVQSGDWVHYRPATAVCGDPRIFKPEYRTGSMRAGSGAIRVNVHEAGVLQGFRPDYPFRGTKGEQFEQVGNAVCPPMAASLIGALEGIPRKLELVA